MGTSFSAHLIGAFFMTLVLFGFYYLSWADDLGERQKWVEANLAAMERQWRPSEGSLKIRYEAIDTSGFPFHSRVTLYGPSVQLIRPEASYAISAPSLTLTLDEPDTQEYHAEFKAGFAATIMAQGGGMVRYDGYLSALPELSLAAQAPQGQALQGWNVFRATLPAELALTVSSEHKNGTQRLLGQAPYQTQWKKLPTQMDYSLRQLVLLMQTISEKP